MVHFEATRCTEVPRDRRDMSRRCDVLGRGMGTVWSYMHAADLPQGVELHGRRGSGCDPTANRRGSDGDQTARAAPPLK